MVTCNAFKHFKELVTSLLVALIWGNNSSISSINLKYGEPRFISLRRNFGQLKL